MALRTQPRLWQPALLAAAGLLPFSACGGATSLDGSPEPEGGTAGAGGLGSGGTQAGRGGQGVAGTPGTGGTFGGGSNTSGTGGTIVIGTGGGPTAGAGGTSEVNPFPCNNPKPYPAPGSGYELCEGDFLHRAGKAACAVGGECTVDAQCGTGRACLCRPEGGKCVNASCTADSDCAPGMLCTGGASVDTCGGFSPLSCQQPADQCAGRVGCDGCSVCTSAGFAARTCLVCCAVGRPFLVGGEARLAAAEQRRDWAAALGPELAPLTAAQRDALRAYWQNSALMEHASIAAFSRFALDLLSLGAPPDLIEGASRAMLDECAHAKACFALAGAFGDTSIGPSTLAVDGSLDARDLARIVTTTVLEGCVGETVAALEAAEALEHATDPAVRAALTRIAQDELEHAALAYRFIAWARSRFGPEVDELTRRAIALSLGRPATVDEADAAVPSHGLLGAAHRAELRARVLSDLVTPSVQYLLAA